MMKEPEIINILGYSSNALAIYFDLLTSTGFDGEINILKNDDRPAISEYDMGLKYNIFRINKDFKDNGGKFLICSSNPYTKYFLMDVFSKYFDNLENRLLTLVHPNSYIGGKTALDQGVIIEPGVTVSVFARLMKGAFIGRASTIGHHNVVGAWSTINPGVTLTGAVKLGEYVTIGPGVTVANGISIGSKSIIGAGSVVMHDVPPGVIAYGNPCKIIKENDKWKI
jgi:acetyltransferase-like isoleucine patch superfamily enzyme